MFKPFSDDETCPLCKKNMNDVALGVEECEPCFSAGEQLCAQRSVLGHVWDAACCFFNFQFFHALAELKWAQERLCKTGDYHPETGRFYKEGYLKKE